MSVEPNEATGEAWTRWQGHVINGVFPLGRYLGCSDHSGVFVTRSAQNPSEVAIKLVPTNRALAESQLPRWKRAGSLAHPHLLRLREWGGCQLDGLPYLYTVMEYADQTLAQLLLQRALTEDEAREMLAPILDALAFLHGRGLAQGQLKPANILVVGDQLKLASDTVRRLSEGSIHTPTRYDPPEARLGSGSAASDIWALGLSLFEALTRRSPAGLGEPREAVVLPADFPPGFREAVARCLSPRPHDRPSVAELSDWVRGRPLASAPVATSPAAVPIPAPQPTRAQQAASDAARPAPSADEPRMPPAVLAVIIGIFVILGLGWITVHLLRSHRAPAPPPVEVPADSLSQSGGAALTAPAAAPAPAAPPPPPKPAQGDQAASPSAVHAVIPEVPSTARRTIRGHIRVWVRVIVNPDGSVFAAIPDRAGPSNYFQRLATEAAKKWMFPPVDTPSQRLMQVRFDFSRDGTTGRAVALH
jgi:hypothetical protein